MMFAIGGVAYLVYRNASSLECEDKVIEELPSPDGKVVAARFEQSCGGDSVATHVQLRVGGTVLKPDSRDAIYISGGRPRVQLKWTSPRALLLEAGQQSQAPDKPQWRNIKITVRLIQ